MRTLYRILAGVAVIPPVFLVAQGKPQAPALDDAAMIGIFTRANTRAIETGSLAATHAARQDVKDFGALLAKDHKVVLDSARALATKAQGEADAGGR
jgi:putative membrane protein